MFYIPPTTRYDLRFSIANIPVRVHPLFWLITIFFGATTNVVALLIWVGVVFVSILIHELGHAFAMRYYGKGSYIVLYHGGGGTVADSVWWRSKWANVSLGATQESIISLAGPFAGFLLAGLIIAGVLLAGGKVLITWLLGFIPLPLTAILPSSGLASSVASTFLWVSIFWGLINLLPVLPLDGGNVARNILVQYDPWKGVRKAIWLSAITGTLVALIGFFIWNSIYIALLFGFLAFQSYQSLQTHYY